MSKFIVIGENIHCTRIYKVGGAFVKPMEGGGQAIVYGDKTAPRFLPVPKVFTEGADWQAGKVKHCAVAAWQGFHGDAAGKVAAIDYLQFLARKQESTDAGFLDVNVDEYSTDIAERVKVIQWIAQVVQQASKLPLSIDSSNPAILRAGLEACEKSRGRPMVNSVSLERLDSIPVAAEFNAVVVASAAGEKDLPSTTQGRLDNLARLFPKLEAVGIRGDAVYVDPLVFPVATDSANAQNFLEAVAAVRRTYGPAIHITGGLSNVSFGMPNRKLINQVFADMAVQVGADSGIVDPLQINGKILAGLDRNAEPYKLAQALLNGQDEFGGEYLTAHRDGRLGKE
jgi:5-methyltetrahydrofolate--homocysteine methyltransferase